MADVSGIGGTDFSVAKGFSPDENARLNRPAREDTRNEDATTSVRSQPAQEGQGILQSPQPSNEGGAQDNRASTGNFTAGETDRPADSVVISAEAQRAARAEPENPPTAQGSSGETAVPAAGANAGPESQAAGAAVREDRTAITRPEAAERPDPTPAPARATAADPAEPAETNQNVRDENSNAAVTGSESNQSEQSRTIGQVLDVFA